MIWYMPIALTVFITVRRAYLIMILGLILGMDTEASVSGFLAGAGDQAGL